MENERQCDRRLPPCNKGEKQKQTRQSTFEVFHFLTVWEESKEELENGTKQWMKTIIPLVLFVVPNDQIVGVVENTTTVVCPVTLDKTKQIGLGA